MPHSSQAARGPASFTLLLGIYRAAPGLALVALVTALAVGLRDWLGLSGLSPMMIGIALGAALCNLLPLPQVCAAGVKFAGKTLLRGAVALLGLQITLGQIAGLGGLGLVLTGLVVFASFGFCLWIGRWLGVGRDLSILIAAGTSVCGAAAIAGVNGTLSAKEEEVTYAVSTITLFGSLGMVAAPLLSPILGLDALNYGHWVGLSLHEVAQVVGAGFQGGETAGAAAVIVKLARVLLLAPLILLIASLPRSIHNPSPRQPILPWFVALFLVLCTLNSTGLVPDTLSAPAIAVTPLLMTAALTALGLSTDFRRFGGIGLRPLGLAAAGTLFISGLALLCSGLFP